MSAGLRPFEGLKVLDLTHALAGPFATQLLADQGADVVKLENPHHQDYSRSVPPFVGDHSHYFVAINHGKRSIAADLRSDEGRRLAFDLACRADILVENFRPGVVERMGLGYEALAAANPRLIHCSISGFGREGELAARPAYDIVIQAMSGFMSVTGEQDGSPLRTGVSAGDIVAGLYALQAISAALYTRERTGRGTALDVPMFDCLASFLSYYLTLAQVTGTSPAPHGSGHPSIVPLGNFPTSDGWIVIAPITEIFWRNLARAVGRPEWIDDPRFHDLGARQRHRGLLTGLLADIFRTRTTEAWAATLDEADVPAGPVRDVLGMMESPLAAARHLLRPVTVDGRELLVTRYPVIDRTQGLPELSADAVPTLGEHGDEVRREWLGETVRAA